MNGNNMNDKSARWPRADGIHLVLSSLGAIVVDARGVASVRTEDASGSFGLWPGHTDLLTVLSLGVLSWRVREGPWHHCALRGGVLTMRRGSELQIAAREAVASDDLERLEHEVLARMATRQRSEDAARLEARQLELCALRELMRPLRQTSAARGDLPSTLP